MSPVKHFYPWSGQWRGSNGTVTDPSDPAPPDTRPGSFRPASTIFGSSSGAPSNTNNAGISELDPYRNRSQLALFDYLQTEFAALAGLSSPPMQAWHNYDDTIPSSIAASQINGIVQRNIHGLLNCKSGAKGSVAAGNFDAAIQSLCNSYTGTKTLYLSNQHEPGNDSDWNATTAQAWRNDQAHFAQKVIQFRGSRPIVPVVCVINWDIHPKNTAEGNGPAEWQNPAAEMVAAGVDLDEVVYTTDGYDLSPTTLGGAANLYTPTSDRVRDWGYSRFGVSEGACKSYSTSSPPDRAMADDWILEARDLCAALDFEYFLWFASGVGNRAGPEGWWIYGDQNKATWARVCAGVTV